MAMAYAPTDTSTRTGDPGDYPTFVRLGVGDDAEWRGPVRLWKETKVSPAIHAQMALLAYRLAGSADDDHEAGTEFGRIRLLKSASDEPEVLERRLAFLRTERDRLQARLDAQDADRERRIGSVVGDEIALFILFQIVEEGGMDVDVLTANLTAPHGWLAFARLWRADLVNVAGEMIFPATTGVELVNQVRAFSAGRGASA